MASIPDLDLHSVDKATLPNTQSPLIELVKCNTSFLRAPPSSKEDYQIPHRQQTTWKNMLKKNLSRLKSHSKSPYRTKKVKVVTAEKTLLAVQNLEVGDDIEKYISTLWIFISNVNDRLFPEWQYNKQINQPAGSMNIQYEIRTLEEVLKALTILYAKVTCLNDVHSFDCLQLPGICCIKQDKPIDTLETNSNLQNRGSTSTTLTTKTGTSANSAKSFLRMEHSSDDTQQHHQSHDNKSNATTDSMESWFGSDSDSNMDNSSVAASNKVRVKLVSVNATGPSKYNPCQLTQTDLDRIDLRREPEPDLASDSESTTSWKSVLEFADDSAETLGEAGKSNAHENISHNQRTPPAVSSESILSLTNLSVENSRDEASYDSAENTQFSRNFMDSFATEITQGTYMELGNNSPENNDVLHSKASNAIRTGALTLMEIPHETGESLNALRTHGLKESQSYSTEETSQFMRLDISDIPEEDEPNEEVISERPTGCFNHENNLAFSPVDDVKTAENNPEAQNCQLVSGQPTTSPLACNTKEFKNYLSFNELQILNRAK